eukprot:1086373_1
MIKFLTSVVRFHRNRWLRESRVAHEVNPALHPTTQWLINNFILPDGVHRILHNEVHLVLVGQSNSVAEFLPHPVLLRSRPKDRIYAFGSLGQHSNTICKVA